MDVRWKGCAGLLLDCNAQRPTRRCNRDITGESPRAALELCESNRNESSAFRNLVEICHALSLSEVMLQQPIFADKFRSSIVGIQWFVSMQQNMPVQIQILECRQAYTGERLSREALGIVPFFRPVGSNHHHGSRRNGSVAVFPVFYIRNGSLVAGIDRDLGNDIDDHQWAQRHRGWDIADGRAVVVLMRRRPELGADMVHRQLIGRDRHAQFFVGEGLPLVYDSGYGDPRQRGSYSEIREAFANRSARCDGVRQVNVLGVTEGRIIEVPKWHGRAAPGLSDRLPTGSNEQRRTQKPRNDPTHERPPTART